MKKHNFYYLAIILIMLISLSTIFIACGQRNADGELSIAKKLNDDEQTNSDKTDDDEQTVSDLLYYDKESPFGLFFYGDNHDIGNIDMKRSYEDLDGGYFDTTKPTIIWVHGWEDKVFSEYDWELKISSDSTSRGVNSYSFVKKLKELGYNVAAFQYQNPELNLSYAADLSKIHPYTLIGGKDYVQSMAFMMASELCINLTNYKQEITYVGHSCGSFVALSINYYVQYFLDNNLIKNPKLIASRIALADPYFNTIVSDPVVGQTIYFTNEVVQDNKHIFFGNVIKALTEKNDVAIDVYLGMNFASSQFKLLEQSVFDCCAVVDMKGLRSGYGDMKIHVLTRDWVFMSLIDGEKIIVDGKVAPSLKATTSELKTLRGTWWNQKNRTITLKNETLTKVVKE